MNIFVRLIYQPFFNILTGIYYLLDQIPNLEADMGIAVILLTIFIRLLMLPITIASTRSKTERHHLQQQINSINKNTPNPQTKKKQIRSLFNSNKRILISEVISFLIQITIFFILYRIFTTGLVGADLYLLYDFMPPINLPFNLYFLGKYDLTHTNLTLNLIQSLTIIAVEAVSLINSPVPIDQSDVVRYLFILPIASFIIFIYLPAGKKLFVITTLWFSFCYIVFDSIRLRFSSDNSAQNPNPA